MFLKLEKTGQTKEFKSNYYANAVFNLARSENAIDRVENELCQLKDEVIFNMDLKKYLSDPAIQSAEKIKSMLNILGDDATKSIKTISAMIIIFDALDYTEQIYKDYTELTNRYKKQVSVEVISAIELDEKLLTEIKKDVDSKTGLDVRVKNTVDKSIIGGLLIKIGERIIDLSVKNKIEDLKSKLKALELRGEDFGFEN
jgi:F-type H+-transporting ATPase subunit delta